MTAKSKNTGPVYKLFNYSDICSTLIWVIHRGPRSACRSKITKGIRVVWLCAPILCLSHITYVSRWSRYSSRQHQICTAIQQCFEHKIRLDILNALQHGFAIICYISNITCHDVKACTTAVATNPLGTHLSIIAVNLETSIFATLLGWVYHYSLWSTIQRDVLTSLGKTASVSQRIS